jgi:hypothetical protein
MSLMGMGHAASAVAAATAPDACAAAKLATAGKYGLCRLKAEAKAVKQGKAPDFAACDATFARTWTKAETRAGAGVCPSEGDTTAVGAFVTRHADDLVSALGGGTLPDHAGDLAACEADLATAVACGNGVVETGEDCDFGDLGTGSCEDFGLRSGELACAAGCAYDTTLCKPAWRRVFVTSTTHGGNFGGPEDGDVICGERAAAAGLGGAWKVWLSASGVHARDRIADAEYRLVDGTSVVATSLADLTDGTIAHAIDQNEFGTTLSGGQNVWTGTLANGTAFALRCSDWSDGGGGGEGMAGSVSSTGGAWTNAVDIMPCNEELHLYCFED